MLWTTSQPILCSDTSHSFFSKPLHFLVPASLVNLLLEDTPNIPDRMKLRDSKRVYLYVGGAQNGCFCPCPFRIPSFACSSSGLNSGRLILLYVPTTASLTILPAKDPQHSFLQPVSLRWLPSWDGIVAGSESSFLASLLHVVCFLPFFLRFSLSLCIGTLGK